MAAQLGLPAIPVEREYLQSWKTLRTAWERCRFVAEIPEALDTDAIGRVCEFRVQGERVARGRPCSAALRMARAAPSSRSVSCRIATARTPPERARAPTP